VSCRPSSTTSGSTTTTHGRTAPWAVEDRDPAAAYAARPKATPTGVQPTHERVRRDRIDDSVVVTVRHHGRLHHIGIGRTHVLLLIPDLNIRVIAAATGELLRDRHDEGVAVRAWTAGRNRGVGSVCQLRSNVIVTSCGWRRPMYEQ
jgi:hypothetical protein